MEIRRATAALGPAWSNYLWEIAVLVLAALKFPHHLVLAVGAVYIIRAMMPLVTARLAAGIDTWPLARAWQILLVGLAVASAGALLLVGPSWWIAVVALEAGQSLVNPIGRKVIYAGLAPDGRKALIRWMGTAENLAMPIAYGILLVAGPTMGLIAMMAAYGLVAFAVPVAARTIQPALTNAHAGPSWATLRATTRSHPAAWNALLGLLPVAGVLTPVNPLAALVVIHRFHAPEAWVGLIFAGLAVGTMGGYRWADHLPPRRAMVLMAVGLVGLAVSPDLGLASAALAVSGVGFGGFMSAQRVLIATQVEDTIRGQVQLIRQVGIAAATILGTLLILGAWAIQPEWAWVILLGGSLGLVGRTMTNP